MLNFNHMFMFKTFISVVSKKRTYSSVTFPSVILRLWVEKTNEFSLHGLLVQILTDIFTLKIILCLRFTMGASRYPKCVSIINTSTKYLMKLCTRVYYVIIVYYIYFITGVHSIFSSNSVFNRYQSKAIGSILNITKFLSRTFRLQTFQGRIRFHAELVSVNFLSL